jgi:hypothetical protein
MFTVSPLVSPQLTSVLTARMKTVSLFGKVDIMLACIVWFCYSEPSVDVLPFVPTTQFHTMSAHRGASKL